MCFASEEGGTVGSLDPNSSPLGFSIRHELDAVFLSFSFDDDISNMTSILPRTSNEARKKKPREDKKKEILFFFEGTTCLYVKKRTIVRIAIKLRKSRIPVGIS